jgi:flagellin
MANVINTNISSLNAQRNLATSQSSLATSLQRLSTGLRINSAKDDSAGQAIATRMTAQISGMQQASRNANDGISMSQTAEAAMSSVNDILLRMRDLAVQSSNGSNGTAERSSIQSEVDQLYQEIDRISGSTQFNGIKLLDGSAKNNTFQVGANAGQTISFGIKEVSSKAMSLNSTTGLGDLNGGRVGTVASPQTGDLSINGTDITFSGSEASIKDVKDAINKMTGTTGVTATAYNVVNGSAAANGVTSGLTIQVGSGTAVTIDNTSGMSDLVDKINKQVGGVTAAIGKDGGLSLTNDTGDTITVGGTTDGSGLDGVTNSGAYNGYLSLSSADGSPVKLGTKDGTPASSLNTFGFNASNGSSSVTSSGKVTAGVADTAAAQTDLDSTLGKLDKTDEVTINGVAIGTSGSGAAEKAAAINAVTAQTGVTAKATTTAFVTMDFTAVGDFSINGANVDTTNVKDMAGLVDAINTAGASGISASADATTGKLVLKSDSGNDIAITNTNSFVATVGDDVNATGSTVSAGQVMALRGKIELTGKDGASVSVGGKDTSITKLGLVAQGGSDEAIGGGLSVSTQANAQSAITRLDKAISFIAEQRSTMGAVQNRLSSTISNLASSGENLQSARSRIQDADFATETANLTRGQILQQAGTAMLAQANSLPNGVLSLLR